MRGRTIEFSGGATFAPSAAMICWAPKIVKSQVKIRSLEPVAQNVDSRFQDDPTPAWPCDRRSMGILRGCFFDTGLLGTGLSDGRKRFVQQAL